MKAIEYIKSQSDSNKWLKELTMSEEDHLADMLEDFARFHVYKHLETASEKAIVENTGDVDCNGYTSYYVVDKSSITNIDIELT